MINFFLQSNDKFFPLPIFFSFIRFSVLVSGSFCCRDDGCQWVEEELRDVRGVVTQSLVMTVAIKACDIPFDLNLGGTVSFIGPPSGFRIGVCFKGVKMVLPML